MNGFWDRTWKKFGTPRHLSPRKAFLKGIREIRKFTPFYQCVGGAQHTSTVCTHSPVSHNGF